MSKYYSLETLIEAKQNTWCDMYDFEEFLGEIPEEKVLKIIRCKNCKHRYVPTRCALWYATLNETEYFIERGDDFYCSFAEPKEI
jgi:hypothetical protein